MYKLLWVVWPSGQHKQIHKQMLEKMQRKGNPSALLVGSLCILMLFSLAMQKLFILMRSHLFILSFMSLALGDILVKILLCGISEIFLPVFS